MKIIKIDLIKGQTFPDLFIYEKAKDFLLSKDKEIIVGNELFITAIRLCVLEKIINNDNILIFYNYNYMYINDRGELDENLLPEVEINLLTKIFKLTRNGKEIS